jgi:hypothetical protein
MSTPTDTKPEETPEPVENAGPVADEHGWVHIDHEHIGIEKKDGPIVMPNCGPPCYQVAR